MSDLKKGNDSQRRKNNSSDDAYDDLLNSYFGPDKSKSDVKKNTVEKISSPKPAAPKPKAQKTGEFKLDIKDLDGEFNAPPVKKTASAGVPRAQLYKKAEPEKNRRTQKTAAPDNHHNTQQQSRTAVNKAEQIDLMPAFEYNKPVTKKTDVQPVYTNPVNGQPPVDSRRAGNNGHAVIAKKNNMPPQKRLSLFIRQNKKAWAIVAICIACAVVISTYTISCMNDILAIRRDSENVVTINIPSEVNTKQAIDILRDNKLIKHKVFCTVFAKMMEYRDDNYLTGIYYLTPSMGLENMLSTFKESPVTGETVTLTFPEGYTVDQIAEKLEKYEVCTKTAFYTTMRDIDFSSEYTFIADEQNKDKRYHALEGYLYPDTYEFFVGENASSVIRKFLDNFNGKWTDEYAAQAQKMNMSVDDVIRLASILEKEAYGADQMPLVSSVLHNRLDKPGLYPTLQCDSTTAYINDYINKNVTDSSSSSKYTQLYSTYQCEGLPVGAICNPGNDAIYGALFPAKTNYYFFLHDDNKKLYLAANDAEHRANGIAALKANSATQS